MSRTVHYIHFNPVHFNPVQLSVLAVVNRSPGTGCLVGLLRRLGTPFLQIRFARCDKPCLGLLPQSRNRGLRMSLFGASRPHRLLSSAAGLVKRPKWNPSESLRFPLRDVDPSTITPSGWVPPQGGYENLPFRVCVSICYYVCTLPFHCYLSPIWELYVLTILSSARLLDIPNGKRKTASCIY